ncbi:cuticle protein 16.8-like [Harmonia axyridis]|uniref:cuticle protein 16.8-like n=1 Tax=Harmonia axyridis TaxID=115357 RepID=UPI001E279175|nr:cuticle protein 16.8-like [Harmonia axyridis]
MFKFAVVALIACVAFANAGVITPLVSTHTVSSHGSIQSHPSPVVHSVHAVHTVPVVKSVVPVVHAVHAAPVVHSVHAVPVVRTAAVVHHAPVIAVHH